MVRRLRPVREHGFLVEAGDGIAIDSATDGGTGGQREERVQVPSLKGENPLAAILHRDSEFVGVKVNGPDRTFELLNSHGGPHAMVLTQGYLPFTDAQAPPVPLAMGPPVRQDPARRWKRKGASDADRALVAGAS